MIVAGALVVLGLIVVAGVEMWLKHKIRAAIEKEVVEVAGTEVTVRVGGVGVNLATRSLNIGGVTLKAQNNDTTNDTLALVSFDARINNISLRGIEYSTSGGKPSVSARELVVDRPHATIVTKKVAKKTSQDKKDNFRQAVLQRFEQVALQKAEVHNAEMEWVEWVSADENQRVEVSGMEFVAEGLSIDTLPTDNRPLFSKGVELDVARASLRYSAGAMVARIDSLSVKSAGTISLAALHFEPQYSKNEYAQKSRGHRDWFKADVTDIYIKGVDWERLAKDEVFAVDTISIGGADIADYKNKQVFETPKVKPLLWQSLQNLPLKVDVPTILFEGVVIRYDELSETGTSPGVVLLSQGSGQMSNVTNIPEGHDPYFTVDFSTLVMNSGRLNATFYFPVNPANDHFRVMGSLGETDMTTLNTVLPQLLNIRVDSGVMTSLVFELNGNHFASHVDMTMLYNGLSVSMLDAEDRSRERKFLTFLADDLLIKNANPMTRERVRTASGHYTRDPNHSMYHYLWHSLVPAIIKTVL